MFPERSISSTEPNYFGSDVGQRLQELSQATLTISSELDLEHLLQVIADTAREFAHANYAAVGVVNKETGLLSRFITSGINQAEREKVGEPPRGHGLLGVLIKQGKALRVADMTQDPRRSGFPPHHPPMTSLLGVPISVQGQVVGDLYLTDKIGQSEFTEVDEWWVTLLAQQAAVAIQNATLYTKTKEIERMKEEFLSMIAHDLKTPLTALKMSAGLLEHTLPQYQLPDMIYRLMNNISRNSDRLASLLNDLLDLTRIEQGRLHLNKTRLDLGEIISSTSQTLVPLFESKHQSFDIGVVPVNCQIQGDRQRLEQIFTNLISNASKYTPSGGKIRIEVFTDKSHKQATVKIEDTGPGIPWDEREKIFDRFYRRAIHEQNGDINGSGLGLPIARSLVELHHGRLWVEGEIGRGSIFYVQLPMER